MAALWYPSAVRADEEVHGSLRKNKVGTFNRVSAQEGGRSLQVSTDNCYTCASPSLTEGNPNGNPCAPNMEDEVFHFTSCDSWYEFVQCSNHGQCHQMPCAPGTAWHQDYRTCCHIQDDKLYCCKDGVCELLPFGTDAPSPSPSAEPSSKPVPDGLGNRQINCDESSDYSDEGPGSFSGDDPKTTYYPQSDVWPPPFDTTADYWCSNSDECDCDACCGIWAETWYVCIPIADAKALGNVCRDMPAGLGGLGALP